MSKLGTEDLRKKAREVSDDPNARRFVQAAEERDKPHTDKKPKLIVAGNIKNRRDSCRAPIQLYLTNDVAGWMDDHALGNTQVVINTLLRRAIVQLQAESSPAPVVINFENRRRLEED